MNSSERNYIAGWKTSDDWLALQPGLHANSDGAWIKAFQEFFLARLNLRYLLPISVLQKELHQQGEGFSILAIQCTLIEFLESIRQGISYRRPTKAAPLGPYEYSTSGAIFQAFLSKRHPFDASFTNQTANDFYVNIRCALLHEARTKGGWRVWADGPDGMVADAISKTVYRNNFQAALEQYIEGYKDELLLSEDMKAAFIRKFNMLCAA